MKRAYIAITMTIFCVVSLVGLDYSLRTKYNRYLTYVSMDALINCESNNVSRILHLGTGDQDITFVIMDYCCINPSGPAIVVFDKDRILLDSTRDFGNDFRFEKNGVK